LALGGKGEADDVHLSAAAVWLLTAQHMAGGGGYAHSFHVLRGWQPPYPETTGYIIPTLHRLCRRSGDPALQMSVADAVAWLKSIQNADGSFSDLQGRAQVFDTGQIIIGLNYLAEHAPDLFDEAMLARAARWLVAAQEPDGSFVRNAYHAAAHSYYARVGAALATAGRLLHDDRVRRAGEANLRWTIAQQKPNGFFRHLFFDRPPPFLHTMVYVIEGLLDGHAELGDPVLFESARRFADPLLALSQSRNQILRSQYDEDFTLANGEKCLVGLAQWAGVCFRLGGTGTDDAYRSEAHKTVDFLKTRQLVCRNSDLHGGLWGSDPSWGRYMRLAIPNWGVKFFIDALLLKTEPSLLREPSQI
jgi:hypothetical protein